MTPAQRVIGRLEDVSDWLSPIVVKEVRQMARGREFAYAFAASLLAGLAVAFFGAANALTGTGTAGRWTFGALTGCLAVLGLAVVPFGAFNTLRTERLEQTLELMTLTALTPRRVVIGKLLAHVVRLATLFAAMAPFLAMSFLLGGIDFVTILVLLSVLFLWSAWMASAGLFLSSLLSSRAMMGLVLVGAAVVLLPVLALGRAFLFFLVGGPGMVGVSFAVGAPGPAGAEAWWALAMMTTLCLASMVNLVLLAENRLQLATEDRVTALRVGFLVQFLLIVGWALSFMNEAGNIRASVVGALGVAGGIHLALVAMFTVTEDFAVPRRASQRRASSGWRVLLVVFRAGGGYAALYVVAQMLLLVATAWILSVEWPQIRWLLALCGYVCFFTGVPTVLYRASRPFGAAAFKLRVAIVGLLAASLVLPDIVYYVLWQPETLDLRYGMRHLLNPLRTLANWRVVESSGWTAMPLVVGITGLLAYVPLLHLSLQAEDEAAPGDELRPATDTEEPRRADAIY
jgi:hypothetical protein